MRSSPQPFSAIFLASFFFWLYGEKQIRNTDRQGLPPNFLSSVSTDDLDTRLFAYSLMCLGLAENPAVFGLCGSLMTRSKPFLFAMIAICLVSWALQFPRYKTFEQKIKLGDGRWVSGVNQTGARG